MCKTVSKRGKIFPLHLREENRAAESVIMEITGESSRKIFERYNIINVDDAKGVMRRSKGY